MNQEAKYLEALRDAERFTRDGSTLLIYCKGMAQPLRFIPKEQ
jgi:heat shock protein HslJ